MYCVVRGGRWPRAVPLTPLAAGMGAGGTANKPAGKSTRAAWLSRVPFLLALACWGKGKQKGHSDSVHFQGNLKKKWKYSVLLYVLI